MILESNRIILRPVKIEDADLIVKWRSDPEISKWIFSQPPIKEEHIKWFYSPKPNRLDYIIYLKDSIPIGTVNYKNIGSGYPEAGILIGDRSQWGTGVAKEAYTLWLKYGFEQLNLEWIYALIKIINIRSVKFHNKVGFMHIETDPKSNLLVMYIGRDMIV